jgi:hypothetical protein
MKQFHPNRRLGQRGADGYPMLRLWHRKTRGHSGPRLLIKCGDCDRALEVFYGGESLEIGGVHASVGEWRKVLLPLLEATSGPGSELAGD